jgi:hypothetical protein
MKVLDINLFYLGRKTNRDRVGCPNLAGWQPVAQVIAVNPLAQIKLPYSRTPDREAVS